ncbi:MAG TPA: hypothetical protein VGK33_14575, partial [Chloroflexota bacterium]
RSALDTSLQENAYLTAATVEAANTARLDEMIGASTMLDESTLNIAEIVGNIKGQPAAQVFADAWRAQTTDLITYSQSVSQSPSSTPPADLDRQSGLIAAQLAVGDFSQQAAETVLRQRTQQELAVADSLASHDANQTAARLATLVSSSGDLSQPLAAGLASQEPTLAPAATDGADVDVRLQLESELLGHVYYTGAAIDAAADNRAGDAQAYSSAAGYAADDLASQLGDMYGADVGNGVADRLRGQTEAMLSAASGGDRHQASENVDTLRGQIDGLLSGANQLLAPGLLTQQLRASDQPMLTAADAFQARDYATAYARLHEAAHQSQKPAETLATTIVDRYPGRYLVLPLTPPGDHASGGGSLRSVGTGHGSRGGSHGSSGGHH